VTGVEAKTPRPRPVAFKVKVKAKAKASSKSRTVLEDSISAMLNTTWWLRKTWPLSNCSESIKLPL